MNDHLLLPRPFTLGSLLKKAFAIYFRDWKNILKNQIVFFGLVLLIMGIFGARIFRTSIDMFQSAADVMIAVEVGPEFDDVFEKTQIVVQSFITPRILVFILAQISQILMIWGFHKKAVAGTDIALPTDREMLTRKALTVFLTALVYGSQIVLLCMVTQMVLYIPMIAYSVLLVFVYQVVILESGGYMYAMRRSVLLVKGHFWLYAGFLVIIRGIKIVACCIIFIVTVSIPQSMNAAKMLNGENLSYKDFQISSIGLMVTFLFTFAVILFYSVPLTVIGKTLLYNSIRQTKEDWNGSVVMPELPK